VAVAAFLRVINALENVRQGLELAGQSEALGVARRARARELLVRAARETDDAVAVLVGAGLHPEAVARLGQAGRLIDQARGSLLGRRRLTREAIRALLEVRAEMVG
jgi:hypothetical protein